MRRILIERARQKQSLKRGGDQQRVDLEAIEPAVLPLACDDLLGLDEALQKLEQKDPRKAELVKLRFFAGLTTAQAAQALGVSVSTAENDWTYARAWLRLEMSGGGHRARIVIFPEFVGVRAHGFRIVMRRAKLTHLSEVTPMTSRQLDEEAIFHVARKLADPTTPCNVPRPGLRRRPGLRERVEALLEVHEKEQDFLKSSPEPAADCRPATDQRGPGHQIGRYKLLQKIGEGGFGVVYMAEQQRPVRRKVALKIIKPGMDTHAVVARFEAERQALALMDHPNIARVLDGGATDSGRPYFVMELVKGVPITEYCDANQPHDRGRLQSVHHGLPGRPARSPEGNHSPRSEASNILVTLHDGKPVVKVIDFGVAKAINQQLTEKTLFTAFGQMVGTPQYMSPEQAEMSGLDVDTRSDIYSLGVLLYELLTGTTPLEGDRLRTAGYAEMQRIIREEEPPKPSTRLSTSGEKLTIIAKHRGVSPERLHKTIRGDLDWIVMKALEKDRARRYETAAALGARRTAASRRRTDRGPAAIRFVPRPEIHSPQPGTGHRRNCRLSGTHRRSRYGEPRLA